MIDEAIKEPWLLAGYDAWERHLADLERVSALSPSPALELAKKRARTMLDMALFRDPADLELAAELQREIAEERGPMLAHRMDQTLPLPKFKRRNGRR